MWEDVRYGKDWQLREAAKCDVSGKKEKCGLGVRKGGFIDLLNSTGSKRLQATMESSAHERKFNTESKSKEERKPSVVEKMAWFAALLS